MSDPINKVRNSVNSPTKVNKERMDVYQVKPNDTLGKIAKGFGMSVDEFKAWTGLKSSSLSVGQKIKLPSATIGSGQGLSVIAQNYGMSFDEFCKLNNIPKPYNDYKPKVNERFYVKSSTKAKSTPAMLKKTAPKALENYSQATVPANAATVNKTSSKSKPAPAKSEKPTGFNKQVSGSAFSPTEIAKQLRTAIENNTAAIGKPIFDNYLKEINPKNVIEVINSYGNLKTGKSLLQTIASEVGSQKESRKAAIMLIYDAMAARQKIAPELREKFQAELNNQFESFGLVNTRKLDITLKRMQYSSSQIAYELCKVIDNRIGAIEHQDFQELLLLVDSKNATEVMKAFSKLNHDKSLLSAITSEFGSSASARKTSVMHIYNSVAKQHNLDDSTLRAKFKQELDKEFNKTFGMVNTKILDKIIKNIMNEVDGYTSKIVIPWEPTNQNPKAKIKLTDSKTVFTAAQLYKDAIASSKKNVSKKFEEYCKANHIPYDKAKLDISSVDKFPKPVVKGNSITTFESKVLNPIGRPNGKVVILNPGHGSYSSRNGYFDPGVYTFIKRQDGKYEPLFEFERMQEYAKNFSRQLRREGYTVIIAGGHSSTMSDQDTFSNLVSRLSTGKKNGIKYSTKDIAFISLHADSSPGKTGSNVCYDSSLQEDTTLAVTLHDSLNKEELIKPRLFERVSGKNGLLVLNQTKNIPSVLLEVEYLNGSRNHLFKSSDFRKKFESKVVRGLNEYFGIA